MIGVFDSGLGGLTVAGEIRELLPNADLVYVADRARAPYGPKPLELVRSHSLEITEYLLAIGSRMIVIACNAASAAALHHLRALHPGIPFVGMEPAVKPAAAQTRSGIVGVLTTSATFGGELMASVVNRFASDIGVIGEVCEGWVELVEKGQVEGPLVVDAVRRHVMPLVEQGADTLVLGCTHYPYLTPIIRSLVGPDITIIDPGPAVARRAADVGRQLGLAKGSATFRLLASGPLEGISETVRSLSGLALVPEVLTWS